LYTGRNNVEEALVSFAGAGGVTFQLSDAELADDVGMYKIILITISAS
jgi:hypothetical protein